MFEKKYWFTNGTQRIKKNIRIEENNKKNRNNKIKIGELHPYKNKEICIATNTHRRIYTNTNATERSHTHIHAPIHHIYTPTTTNHIHIQTHTYAKIQTHIPTHTFQNKREKPKNPIKIIKVGNLLIWYNKNMWSFPT